MQPGVRRSLNFRAGGRLSAAGSLTGVPGLPEVTSEWRNWQTRQLEGLVPARAWGFKSPLRHHENPYLVGVFGAFGTGLEGIWKEIVLQPVPPNLHP